MEKVSYIYRSTAKNAINKIVGSVINAIFFSCLLFVLLQFGCEDSGTNTENPPTIICYDTLTLSANPLTPGGVGSYWKYNMFIYNKTKRYENDTTWRYKDFSSFRIDFDDTSLTIFDSRKREIANKLIVHSGDYCYEVIAYINTSLSYTNPKKLYWLYWIGTEGVYEMGGYNEVDTVIIKGLKFPYPIKKGDKWRGQHTYYDGSIFRAEETILSECIADNEKLVTPFFTIDSCYVMLTRIHPSEDVGGYDDYYQYYAPNKGLVCQVLKHTSPNDQDWFIVSVLLEYERFIK